MHVGDSPEKDSGGSAFVAFFKTLPGLLTAIATLITALAAAGLIALSSNEDEADSEPDAGSAAQPTSTEEETQRPPDGNSAAPLPAGFAKCGDRFPSVEYFTREDTTSCQFAAEVTDAWSQNPGASTLPQVPSPVTSQTYDMSCSGEAPVRCEGGNQAVVLIYPDGLT